MPFDRKSGRSTEQARVIWEEWESRFRLVGASSLSPEQLAVFGESKSTVIGYLEAHDFARAAEKVRAIDESQAVVFTRAFVRADDGNEYEISVRGQVSASGAAQFHSSVINSPEFPHVSTHELFHVASQQKNNPLVEIADGTYIKIQSGMSSYPVRSVLKLDSPQKTYFEVICEGVTDILTRMNLPAGAAIANPGFRTVDMFVVHALVRKLAEVRGKETPGYSLHDAWNALLQDYFKNTHTTLLDLERGFGRGSMRAISHFVNERDANYSTLEMLYPKYRGSFGKNVVSMMFGKKNAASEEFERLERELFAAVQ